LAAGSRGDDRAADRIPATVPAVSPDDDHASAPDGSSAGNPPGVLPLAPATNPATVEPNPFRWRPAVLHAAFFTIVMHAHRFATEAGTRDAVRGRFFPEYFDSVRELRGWDDGDGFTTSYVGHPMEGSVFAFIQVQNDPRYRTLRFNEGRDYWISRLRALAFSTVWSTLWTMGPVSEASLGNVQLHASPGFVDLVVTPTLGTGWAVGEDAIDRYLMARLEEHTANRLLLMVARGLGNPTRSFANVMGGRRPWQRDTRPGLFGADFVARSESIRHGKDRPAGDGSLLLAASSRGPLLAAPVAPSATYPKAAPIELTAGAHYETFLGGGSCIGGGGSGAARISPSWQIVAEVSGCLIVNMPTNQSGDSLLYVVGPRWTPRATHHLSPYSQLLVGGRKVTHEILDPELRAKLQNEWDAGRLPHYPVRSDYSVESSVNGFALLAGGGMDINVRPALTVRVANLEYTRSFIRPVDRIDASQGIRFASGLVLRIGTW
jgi:hypothetical protein